jgi:hypothetical protein
VRLTRQLQALDAWHVERDRLLSSLESGPSRELRLDAARRREVLLHMDGAVKERAGGHLLDEGTSAWGPAQPTAVVAHPHEWYAGKLTAALTARGIDVIECTGQGAEAAATVIVEQPDLVIVHETLAMLTGAQLVSFLRVLAPATVTVAQSHSSSGEAELLEAGVGLVLGRAHPPEDLVAEALTQLQAHTDSSLVQPGHRMLSPS